MRKSRIVPPSLPPSLPMEVRTPREILLIVIFAERLLIFVSVCLTAGRVCEKVQYKRQLSGSGG